MAYPIVETTEKKMRGALEHFQDALNEVRTGMANANMLNKVMVDYYGSPTPLNQIASISVQEGRTLVIKPYDANSLKDIEKACNVADLGIAPINDGSVVRLTVPQLTGETRQEMTKKVSKLAEEAKVQVRNVRRDAMQTIKKDEADEDVQRDQQDEIQKLTDKLIKEIDDIAKAKNEEVLKV